MRWIDEVAMAYEGDQCLPWPFGQDGQGRGSVCIDGKHKKPHRIICERAHGQPESPDLFAAHSCGNGHLGCCTKKHLRWATPAENTMDSMMHGTFLVGENSPHAKIEEMDVHMIRALSEKGFSQKQIARRFAISPQQVAKIALRKKWSWLGDFQPAKVPGGFRSRALGPNTERVER
ncbi:hypothetical protein [Neorhizobium sp. AL 9.2.2]|uniref:hypothetical protein n=1 Tax=Neorhizobium sp. AL 9.2.2 TaxID=2712894 RepID=UPI0015723998|nr:hypothetical protein [Neorhizobium sp. AL 9.2.2]NSY17215.1 hypothetical protein [Neorhizobium sp. AL 9.2.2]